MNVDDIDTYPVGAVVNFQRSNGSVVSARILAPQSAVPTTGPPHAILYFTRDVLEAKCLCSFCRAFSAGRVFLKNVPCLKFPCSPPFAIALSYPAQAAIKPRAVLEINVSQKLKFVYL